MTGVLPTDFQRNIPSVLALGLGRSTASSCLKASVHSHSRRRSSLQLPAFLYPLPLWASLSHRRIPLPARDQHQRYDNDDAFQGTDRMCRIRLFHIKHHPLQHSRRTTHPPRDAVGLPSPRQTGPSSSSSTRSFPWTHLVRTPPRSLGYLSDTQIARADLGTTW